MPSPATCLFRLRVTERRPDVEGPAEDVVDGRSARPLLHDLLFLLRELALSGDVELHGAKRFLPVHRVFRARDRARINVEVRSNLEPFEVDALPGAVQRDGLGHARAQRHQGRLDRFDPVSRALDAEGVSNLSPRPELNREVPRGPLHRVGSKLPWAHLPEIPEASSLPDASGLETEREALGRLAVFLVERFDLPGIDPSYRHPHHLQCLPRTGRWMVREARAEPNPRLGASDDVSGGGDGSGAIARPPSVAPPSLVLPPR